MSRQFILWTILGVLGGGALLAASSFWWKDAHAHAGSPSTVYVCRNSGDLFIGRGPSGPQIHPETGLATLFPGLYCPQCDDWKTSPPPERLYGHPEWLNCPSCQTPRTFDGVIPEGTWEL